MGDMTIRFFSCIPPIAQGDDSLGNTESFTKFSRSLILSVRYARQLQKTGPALLRLVISYKLRTTLTNFKLTESVTMSWVYTF